MGKRAFFACFPPFLQRRERLAPAPLNHGRASIAMRGMRPNNQEVSSKK